MSARESLADRLRLLAPPNELGCWVWTVWQHGGYGYVQVGGKNRRAMRVSYELFVGPIPSGLVLDHLCRNRLCVNPEHLEPVTTRVNILRGASFAAVNALKTHCKRGHAFDRANTYMKPDGARGCRTCQNAASNAYKARRRGVVA